MNDVVRTKLNWLQTRGLIVGLAGLALCGLGWMLNSRQFFISYLTAYIFWLGLSLGCLGVAMIHHLTGGRWGFATRRFLEAGFTTLPVMAILFIPLLFGLSELYPWARGAASLDHIVREKAAYLNTSSFVIRAIFFFIVCLVFAFCLRRWSLQQDATREVSPTIRLRTLSGPGIVVYPLTATF